MSDNDTRSAGIDTDGGFLVAPTARRETLRREIEKLIENGYVLLGSIGYSATLRRNGRPGQVSIYIDEQGHIRHS